MIVSAGLKTHHGTHEFCGNLILLDRVSRKITHLLSSKISLIELDTLIGVKSSRAARETIVGGLVGLVRHQPKRLLPRGIAFSTQHLTNFPLFHVPFRDSLLEKPWVPRRPVPAFPERAHYHFFDSPLLNRLWLDKFHNFGNFVRVFGTSTISSCVCGTVASAVSSTTHSETSS